MKVMRKKIPFIKVASYTPPLKRMCFLTLNVPGLIVSLFLFNLIQRNNTLKVLVSIWHELSFPKGDLF